MINWNYSKQELLEAVTASECFSDVCRKLNVTICTHSFNKIKERCAAEGIDHSHFNRLSTLRRNKKNFNDDEVYIKESKFPRAYLRRRVLIDSWLDYKCRDCGIDSWNNKPITLEVEHVNGINDDHRKSNLAWLCPNCHSQTPTFRNSKNRIKGY